MVPVSTKIGRLNVMSQLHFDGDPGTVSFGTLQTPPVFCDQLVQLGRFNLPSLSVSTQLTLSTRTVTTLPFGGPHPLAVLMSRTRRHQGWRRRPIQAARSPLDPCGGQ